MLAWLLAFALCLPSLKAEAAHPVHGEIKALAAELRLESRKTGAKDFAAIEAKAALVAERSRSIADPADRSAAQALLEKFRSLLQRAKQGEALEDEGQEGPYVVPPPVPRDGASRERLDRLKDEAGLAGDAAKGNGVFDGKKGGGGLVSLPGPGADRQTEQVGKYVRRHKSKDGTLLGHDMDISHLLFPDHPSRKAWALAAALDMIGALGMDDPGGKKAGNLAAWILKRLDDSDRFKAGQTWRLYFTAKGKVHFVRVVGEAEIMDPDGAAVGDVMKPPSAPTAPKGPAKVGRRASGGFGKKKGGKDGDGGSAGKSGGGRRGGRGGGRGFGGKGGAGGIGGRGGASGSARAARGGSDGGGRLAKGRGRDAGGSDFGSPSGGGRSSQRWQARKTSLSKPPKPAGAKRGGGPNPAKGGSVGRPGKAKAGAAGAAGKAARGDKSSAGRGGRSAGDGGVIGFKTGGKGRQKGAKGGMDMKEAKAPAAAPSARPGPSGREPAGPGPAERSDIAFTDAPTAQGAVMDLRDAVAAPPVPAGPLPAAAAPDRAASGRKQGQAPAKSPFPAVGWGFMVGFATGAFRIVRMWKWARRGYEAVSAIFDTTEAAA